MYGLVFLLRHALFCCFCLFAIFFVCLLKLQKAETGTAGKNVSLEISFLLMALVLLVVLQ